MDTPTALPRLLELISSLTDLASQTGTGWSIQLCSCDILGTYVIYHHPDGVPQVHAVQIQSMALAYDLSAGWVSQVGPRTCISFQALASLDELGSPL